MLTGGSGADTIDGGADNDTILGKGGADTLLGGDGSDSVTGGDGNDLAFLGAGNDVFIWNPGDDSDLVEGQGGLDTVVVNGGNGAEIFDISANGRRVRFDRIDPAPFTLDLDDVEHITCVLNGGADTITVNDLSGTDVTQVRVDFGDSLGGGDDAADSVIVNATNGADQINVAHAGGSANRQWFVGAGKGRPCRGASDHADDQRAGAGTIGSTSRL